jgi:hypothetical protein
VFGVNGTAASPMRYRALHPLWMVDPRYATVLGAGGGQAEAS